MLYNNKTRFIADGTMYTLPVISEDEAIEEIKHYLLQSSDGYISVGQLVQGKLKVLYPSDSISGEDISLAENQEVYHAALWRLVRRGISYLSTSQNRHHQPDHQFYGPPFKLTEYGTNWLEHAGSDLNCLPTEYDRFASLLDNYKGNFGSGHQSRSNEAIRCYKAQVYLSCCVMCGAATESILLATAIAKSGNEAATLDQYRRASGLKKIVDTLSNRHNSVVKERLSEIQDLVHHWRNESAHGEDSTLGEPEAFRALLLLHRFSHFVDDHWDDLTASSV